MLILLTTAARVIASAVLPLHQDEAYHHVFTQHAALSYFDHPPMVMWVGWLGVAMSGGGVTTLTARLGFILLMAGSLWLTSRLTARWYGEWAGFYAALLLAASGYHGTAGGMILPESPLVFFTLLTIWAATSAITADPARLRPWCWVGVAFAGAMLSKYFAIFLPAGVALYLLLTAPRRLLTRGPYLAVAIGLLGFAPVLIWNAQHGWASFAFQGGRATAWVFDVEKSFGRQFTAVACLLPWVWAILFAGLIGTLRRFRSAPPVDRLLVCLAVLPLAVFIALSFVRAVLPHWLLYGYLPLFPLAGARLAAWSVTRPRAVRRGVAAAMVVLLIGAVGVVAQVRYAVVPLKKDPSADFGAWGQVVDALKARGLTDRPNTFVFTSEWNDSAQLEFWLRAEPVKVACYDIPDARGYAFWSRPEEYVGMDGVYVSVGFGVSSPELYREYFRSVELIAEIQLTRGGRPFEVASLYMCTGQFQLFPFDGRVAGPR